MSRSSRLILYFLILLSGAAGLIYEVVWARQLTLFIGNTAIANAAVLTAFMLGLALGSLVLGRKADTIASPLRLYALFEILIGCYGATTPWLFDILQAAYAESAGVVGVTGSYSHLPRFLIAIVAMLIPTFLMGGTLPLLVKHFAGRVSQAQSVTSRIYGINTLGATAGAFGAGFLLLPRLGITETLLLAAAINIVVGIGVYRLLLRAGPGTMRSSDESPSPQTSPEATPLEQPRLLLVSFGLSGFAALLYQVVWIHSLVLVIGVSIYAFSTVLTVFLAGIGLGSLLIGRLATHTDARHSLKLASYLQIGIALSAIVSLSLLSQLPILFVHGWARFHESFTMFQAYMFLLSAFVIFVPTLLLGALFPLITGIWSKHTGAVGQGVGEAYGANALGTIAGSAIGGLFILDWLGIEGSLYLASIVSGMVAAVFWNMSSPDRSLPYRWMQIPLGALAFIALMQVLPGWDKTVLQSQVFRHADRYGTEDVRAEIDAYMNELEFLYYKEGIHGIISVLSHLGNNGVRRTALMNNGKVDATTAGDMDTQILLGQLPMFMHEAPNEVMVIGLGSGITAGSVLQTPAVKNLDILEISPEVVEASRFFEDANYDVLDNPRTNMIVADARNYLLAYRKNYDVIISEPSHSWVTGVSNLFTREFLQQAKERLNKGGILAQWYHLYGIDRESLTALLRAVSDVFPHYTLWYLSGGDIIIVSSNDALELDYQRQLSFFESPEIRADLARIDIGSVEELMSNILLSSDETRELLAGKPGNTDDNPIVEFNAPRHIYRFTSHDNIRMLFGERMKGKYRLPFVNLVEEHEDWISVPFMGIRMNHGGNPYSAPTWNIMRETRIPRAGGKHRLVGEMRGEITLDMPWGDVPVRTRMAQKERSGRILAWSMLEDEIPKADELFGGELRAPGAVVYWRVGPSPQLGAFKLVLARNCSMESTFENWISYSSHYPGDTNDKNDISTALRATTNLVQCINK